MEKTDNFEQVEKLWGEITETLSKLSYISAGAISLSITFLGYILSIGKSASAILNTNLFCGLPIIYLLFASWVLLLFSLFLGIIARLPNAWYIFNAHAKVWMEDKIANSTGIIKENFNIVKRGAKKDMEKYNTINNLIRWITIIFFGFGISVLVIFVIMVANQLIKI
jgi:hypothetical protein